MAPSADLKAPRPQKSRSRSNCACGDPCFYCGEPLEGVAHDHDHFPVPWRYGGRLTVATCRWCHDLKDRVRLGRWAPAALRAAEEGLSDHARHAMRLMFAGLVNDEGFDDWQIGDEATVTALVEGCTTTEAKIAVAQVVGEFLDRFPPQREPVDPNPAPDDIASPVALRLF